VPIQGGRLSYYSVKPIQLELAPSANLVWMIVLGSLAACLILLFLPLPTTLKGLTVLSIVALAVYYIRQHGTLTLTKSIVRLTLNPQTGLQITQRDGMSHQVAVLTSSFVAPYLTVLNLQATESGGRFSLILLSDNIEPESFCQLRVWLRWGRERQAADNLS
jgi:toxin CptA